MSLTPTQGKPEEEKMLGLFKKKIKGSNTDYAPMFTF